MKGIVDLLPFWAFLPVTMLMVMASIDAGHRVGVRRRLQSGKELQHATSAISAGLVSLNSFFLAFTFGMAADRYESRRELVREDAVAIELAFFRTDLLQDPGRSRARELLREYLDERIRIAASGDVSTGHVVRERTLIRSIQRELWSAAVSGQDGDPDRHIVAQYMDSLGQIIAIDIKRWAVGYQARLPTGVWGTLAVLNVLSAFSIGFLVGTSGSSRSFLTPALVLAFSVIITLIAILDRPDGHFAISQQPLLDLQAYLARQHD